MARDLIRALNDPARHPVGVRDPVQTASEWHWDAHVPANQAFVRRLPGAQKDYWTHVDLGEDWRAFLSFLDSEFGLPRSAIQRTWHVDHVLNLAFAREH